MSRPRKPLDPLGEGPKLLKQLSKTSGWQRERLIAIKQALEGEPSSHIAHDLGRSHQTIQTWLNRFRERGIEGLLSKSSGKGQKSRLTPEIEEALKAELAKGQWRRAQDAWDWLCENYPEFKELNPLTVYKYLGKCGGRLKVPRPSNPKKDPEKEAAFRKELADNMAKLKLPEKRPVRLWVYDEMRYGLHPLTRRMWSLKGVRAIAPSRRRYKNGYVFGALQIGGGGSEFLLAPRLNKK